MALFKYKPLTVGENSIRLLRVEPVNNDSKHVSCLLEEASLNDPGTKYIALSHVWGIDDFTATILVNGLLYQVTPQLWQFLVLAALRIPNENLWIDAICIDQSRPLEKSQQIPMMGQIYSSAESLLSWLWGPLDSVYSDSSVSLAQRQAAASISDVLCDISRIIDDSPEIRQVLLRLIFHNYWSRVWIVQEIRLGRDREFWWEGQRISGSRLLSVATQVVAYAQSKFPGRKPRDPSSHSHLVWESLSTSMNQVMPLGKVTLLNHTQADASSNVMEFAGADNELDLAQTVIKHKEFKCGLRADHVFGFLGIVKDGHLFHVKYGMLETDFLVQIWNASRSMDHRALAAIGAILNIPWGRLIMHKVNLPWYTELERMLQLLQVAAPSLRQGILGLNHIKSLSGRGYLSLAASVLPQLYNKRATRQTQPSHAELLAEVERLVKSQGQEVALKIPTLGMYYIMRPISKNDSNHMKVRKLLKVSYEPRSEDTSDRDQIVKVAIVEDQADSPYMPSMHLDSGAMLSLMGSLTIAGLTPSQQPQNYLRTMLVDLNTIQFNELLQMSIDTHAVWRNAQRWTVCMPATSSAST